MLPPNSLAHCPSATPGFRCRKSEWWGTTMTGVALEGPNPSRPDLDWRWHEGELERGCMMSINPDAHSTDQIDHAHWGVELARKGAAFQRNEKPHRAGRQM